MKNKIWPQMGLIVLTMGLLTACGGGDPAPKPTPPPDPAPSVARVELNSASLVLEQGKAGQKLMATAFDASGKVVNVPITFTSSKPDVIGVATDGTVTAKTVGSSQITATVGNVSSVPGVAASGVLSDNVVHISEQKVLSGPVFAEGVTPFSVGSTYTVILKDVSPTAGKLWFSKAPNGMTVQGKVLSSKPVASGTEVTLEIVPYTEIFKNLQVDEQLSISSKEVEFSEQTRANFDIQALQNGDFKFTPKRREMYATSGRLEALDFNVGPFSCSGSLPQAAFSLGSPSFTLSPGNPTFNVVLDLPLIGTKRLKVLYTASPSLRVTSGTHTLRANFNNQSTTCKFREAIKVNFGVFGLDLVAKMRPVVTLGGSFGSGTRTFSAVGSASANVRMGFDCKSGMGCTNLSQANLGDIRGAVNLGGSGDLIRTARNLEIGVFLDTTVAASLIVAEIDIIRSQNGYKADIDVAPLKTQIGSNNGADYKVGEFAKIDPFVSIKDIVHTLTGQTVAGLPDINISGRGVQSPIITSARQNGTGSSVTVNLDSNRVNFFNIVSPFSLGYNVKQVQLVKLDSNGNPTILTSVTPSSGATSVTLSIPPRSSQDTSPLYVTVIPKVLDLLPVGTVKVQ